MLVQLDRASEATAAYEKAAECSTSKKDRETYQALAED